ncbi:DUF2242 domain-containing protein [Variovorax sp. J22R133]|uniref:DUF2242 domain-containing protein n=1 Tax=Variovorax brevis TaxID=3053503 RepID=UPI0025754F4A|nr:DUF2242 domain-containing protein [Variovorax sp. J22R133]MDM0115715.1 DUF2242 domain-containing protein [Variovorax sp. J22R133]
MMSHPFPRFSRFAPSRPAAALLAFAAILALAGCGTNKPVAYNPETFASTDTHARTFEASEAQTCEAARRALLSQGYLVTAANSELVTGKKAFQPAYEVHVEVEFRVVCAKDVGGKRKGPKSTIAFVSAVQDRYSLKKVNNSASVGVGMIGSVSLPYSSSDDAMVKVGSQTVTDERFYERFYALIERYVVADGPEEPVPVAATPPAASPAAPAAGAAPTAKPPAATAASATTTAAAPAAPKAETTPASTAPSSPAPAAPDAAAKPAESSAASKPVEPLGEPASMPKASDPPPAGESATK